LDLPIPKGHASVDKTSNVAVTSMLSALDSYKASLYRSVASSHRAGRRLLQRATDRLPVQLLHSCSACLQIDFHFQRDIGVCFSEFITWLYRPQNETVTRHNKDREHGGLTPPTFHGNMKDAATDCWQYEFPVSVIGTMCTSVNATQRKAFYR